VIVAFDFDGTYTAHPDVWDEVLQILIDSGHTVICVTGRGDHHHPLAEDVIRDRLGSGVQVIRAAHLLLNKREAAEVEGYSVDVWIDDEPWGVSRSEEGRVEGKRRQKIRSRLAGELPKDTSFEEYIEELHLRGIL